MESEIYEKAKKMTEGRTCGRHTFFQLKHFVLGKELTTQAKLQKCLREVDARRKSLKSMFVGLEDAEDELELLGIKAEVLEKKKPKDALDRRQTEIQKRRLGRKREMLLDSIDDMRQKIREAEEETDFFIRAFEQLEKVEPLRRYDDPDANSEFWNENFMQDLRLRLMLGRPVDTELVRCILAMDEKSPVRVEMVGILEQIRTRAMTHEVVAEGAIDG